MPHTLSMHSTHVSAPLAAAHAQAEKVTDQAEKLHFSICGVASELKCSMVAIIVEVVLVESGYNVLIMSCFGLDII